jgi:hypothetical protein
MKSLRPLFLLIFLFPVFGFAQSINGVYTGVLSNDSTTIRKDQSFEMALTEYRGKVFGYAYSTFIINDTLYYIVKRVKGKVEGDICEVEDDEVITHNFPQKPEKKVFVTYTLHRNANDSIWRLDGNWKTNLTKKYYAISGKVDAKEEKDLSKSKLLEHLGDLNLQNTLAFTKPKEPEKKSDKAKESKTDIAKNTVKKETNKKPDAAVAKNDLVDQKKDILPPNTEIVFIPEIKRPTNTAESVVADNTEKTVKKDIVSTKTAPDVKPDSRSAAVTTINQSNPNEKKDAVVPNSNPVEKKPENSVVKQETKLPDNKLPVTVNNQPNQNEKKNVAPVNTAPDNKSNSIASNQTQTNTQEKKLVSVPPGSLPGQSQTNASEKKLVSVPPGSLPKQDEKKDVAVNNQKPADKKQDAGFEFNEVRKTDRKLKPAATLVDGRVTIPSETIFFKSDSLSIALYDNGEVDGDSVSVIINDEMFIEKQLLKSSAFKKTYYVPKGQSDSLLVVLYADNLGKYPPNTGLLQIKDGEEIFYVRFKADLDRNAAIVLRRKSK